MKLEKDDAKIGFLVILALAVFTGFLFHRSLSALLKKETPFGTVVESANDVSEGTEVQLQGLRVGQVKRVNLDREGVHYRFHLTLGLRPDIVLWEGTRAVVVAKPLGGAFVDIQLPDPAKRTRILAPESLLEGSVSASLGGLLDDASHLVANLDGAVGELRTAFKSKGAGVVLDDPRIARVLQDLDETLTSFRKLAVEGAAVAHHGDATLKLADDGLEKLDKSMAKVQTLLDNRAGDLDAIITRLAATLKETETLAKEAESLLKTAGPEAATVLKTLERNLDSTEELLSILKAKPNRVVWGKPSAAEVEAARKRVREAKEAQK
jgi:ABC-type transporter Mla subunit MlaD